jgi:hypothetical protein
LGSVSCDLFSVVRRLYNTLALLLVAFWLPATLRCEIETVPGLEFFGCETPCNGVTDKSCTDGCAILETGLIKISNDDVKASPPTEALLCQCLICLPCEFREPDPDADFSRPRDGDGDERQRTWQFVQRAAQPSRAPSV